MKILIIFFIIAFNYGCNSSQKVTTETSSSKINSSAPYLWATTSFPRNLKTSSDFSDDEFQAIKDMAGAWENSVDNKLNFFSTTERTPEISSPSMDLDSIGEDGVSGVYKITSWPLSLSTSALAVTQIFGRRFNTGTEYEFVRIEHADILVNENIFNFRTSSPGISGSYDFKTVILHELGHFLGLGHKSYGDTVMKPSIGTSTVMNTPGGLDEADLADKYNISLGSSPMDAEVSVPKINLNSPNNIPGEDIKIIIELHSNGECLHRENGILTLQHFVIF